MADSQKRLRRHITKLIASSVVRGSHRGESHGGAFVLDLEKQSVLRTLDWSNTDIEWHGAGCGRGLRGIAFDDDIVYIATSDELLAYTPKFEEVGSWRNPFLKYCHEIMVWERTLYLTSAGYDSILGFDLDAQKFCWAMHVQSKNYRFMASIYDPLSDDGPLPLNKYQLNNVHCNQHGMYITGLRTSGMLHFNGKHIRMAVELPDGSLNAQPFRDGVLFNDSDAGVLRYTGRGEGEEDRAMAMPAIDAGQLNHSDAMADGLAKPGFARGLCVLSDRLVAGGSSPSTISLYDLAANETLGSVSLSLDVRSTIHSLAQWPFD